MNAATKPPPGKHDVPECAVTVSVGDHLFCAKHTFAEMDDMHIIFGHEYGLKSGTFPSHQIPNRKVFASIVTHTYARTRARGI
jgi:hypothetical protein